MGLGWAALGKLKLIFKIGNGKCLARVYLQWTELERSMFGITLIDKMTNQWIRQQMKIVDVIERIASLKWNWENNR